MSHYSQRLNVVFCGYLTCKQIFVVSVVSAKVEKMNFIKARQHFPFYFPNNNDNNHTNDV